MARTMLSLTDMKATLSSLLFVLIAGCYGETRGTVAYSSGPDYAVVEAEPGVEVIADYDYPVVVNGGFYWRYDNGVWLRSRDFRRGGWERVRDVPTPVARIERPERFRHFHAQGRVVRREHR